MPAELDGFMQRFRLASRALFNSHFYETSNQERAWDAAERFEAVEEQLFAALVTYPAQLPAFAYLDLQTEIGVRFKAGCKTSLIVEVENANWVRRELPAGDAVRMCFESFFDWDQAGIKEYRYARVQILRCNA